MTEWPSKPFLVDRNGAVVLTYRELGLRLAAFDYPAVVLPTNTADALSALVVALVRQIPLRMVDSDLSDSERHRLGVSDLELATRVSCSRPPPTSLEQAQAEAFLDSGFSLSLCTSGSTGLPKVVTHRRDTLTRTLRVGPRHAEDVWGLAYNSAHIAGVQVALQAFFNGNTLVDVFGLDSGTIQRRFRQWAVTHISATPTFYRLLLPLESPISSVCSLTLGGERSDPVLIQRLREAFPAARLHNLYASTEAGTLLVADGDHFGIHESVQGLVRVDDNQLLVAKSLLAAFEGVAFDGDWYPTGDRVEIVSEMPLRFRILGRTGDFINVGGSKVDPTEVEDSLRAYPGIVDARVYGRSSSVVGTLLCADYTSSTSITESELRSFLSGQLQQHKIPRLINRVDTLAMTLTGKLSRRG